jgi:hypothetical protein
MKKVYTVYKTTNKVNGKFYIGVHKTSNPFDDYYGSGKFLKRAVAKYGIENFEKEILAIFEIPEDAYAMEAELVTFELIESGQCYNLKEGGKGGFDHLNSGNDEHIARCKLGFQKQHQIMLEKYGENYKSILMKEHHKNNPEQRKHFINALKKGRATLDEKYPDGIWKGKKHKEESKRKIGASNSIKQRGELNSNYGNCWITKDGDNKSIKKEELEVWLEQGWIKGRKLKGTN